MSTNTMGEKLKFGAFAMLAGVALTGCQMMKDIAHQQKVQQELTPYYHENNNRNRGDGKCFNLKVSQSVFGEATTNMTFWTSRLPKDNWVIQTLNYSRLSGEYQNTKGNVTPEFASQLYAANISMKQCGYDAKAKLSAIATYQDYLNFYNIVAAWNGKSSMSAALTAQATIEDKEKFEMKAKRLKEREWAQRMSKEQGSVQVDFPRLSEFLDSRYGLRSCGINSDEIASAEERALKNLKEASLKTELQCIKAGDSNGFIASHKKHMSFSEEYLKSLKENSKKSAEIAEYLYKTYVNEYGSPARFFIPLGLYDLCDKMQEDSNLRRAAEKQYAENMYRKGRQGELPEWDDPVTYAVSVGALDYLKSRKEKLKVNEKYALGKNLSFENFWKAAPFPQWAQSLRDRVVDGKTMDETQCREKYECHLIDIALCSGQVDIATYLYDLGSPEPCIGKSLFWEFWNTSKTAFQSIAWLVDKKVLKSQAAYDKVLTYKNASVAKAFDKKYPGVKITKTFDKYFEFNEGDPTPDQVLELAKYLVSKGVALENKATGYSALAEIAINSWYNTTLNKPATMALMKYLVEQGVDVTRRGQYSKEVISDNDWAKVCDLSDCAILPATLRLRKSDLGVDDAGVNKLIQAIEDIPNASDFEEALAGEQLSAALGGNEFATIDPSLKNNVIKRRARYLIRDVMLQSGKIKRTSELKLELDALGGAAYNGNLELVKLLIEKGAKLPCMVKTADDGEFNIQTKSPDNVANYLRVAERKQKK